ncbi:MAG: diguanylate cyclase [Longimicrobiaceae bacterium]
MSLVSAEAGATDTVSVEPGFDLRGLARDPLTDALPRAAFEEQLELHLEQARLRGAALSLLVVDLDHFKSINDAFGHSRGDAVLREFAERVQGIIRGSDLLFRYGGDEFLLLLPETSREQAAVLAHRLLTRIGATPFPGNPAVSVSLSIGVASFPEEAPGGSELFERADRRVYEAKRRGRSRVVSDDQVRQETGTLDPPARLVDREEPMQALHGFLAGLREGGRGVLAVLGTRGAGRTRFLAEARTAALLQGYEAVALRGTPALRARAFGALRESRREFREALPHSPRELAALLGEIQRVRARSGVVLLLDDVHDVDEETLELLRGIFEGCDLPVVGVVFAAAEAQADDPHAWEGEVRATIALPALGWEGVRTWARTVLRWEPPEELLGWLHRETGGLPGRMQAALELLVEERALQRAADGWSLREGYQGVQVPAARGRGIHGAIPAVSTSILGRDVEIGEVKQLLRDGRLVTLTGPGGIGKTRLAIQVAAELAESAPGGVHFVELAPLSSPEFLVPAIAEAAGLQFSGGSAPRQQLLDFLRDRQLLLVLDNFEHLVAGEELVGDLLRAAPRVRVLATSRERLSLREEAVYPLRGMPIPREGADASPAHSIALRLFANRARRHHAAFVMEPEDVGHVVDICRMLGGLPLGIELAASLVRVLSCREIAEEVAHSFDALSTPLRDSPSQHRSLRAVFDSSWNLLDARERDALRRLAVFRGGFRKEAAQRVAGAGVGTLAALVDKSLLTRTPAGRYQLHEVFRAYGEEKLREDADARREAGSRCCAFYAAFLAGRAGELVGPRQAEARAEIGEEVENVRAGWQWAVESADAEALEAYVEPLFRFYAVRSWYHEGEGLFAAAAARVERGTPLFARLIARQAFFHSRLGRYEEARALHRESLAILRAGGGADAALSHWSLGSIALKQGLRRSAVQSFRRGLRLYREAGDRDGVATCLNEMGAAALAEGRWDDAERLFARSRGLRERLGDRSGLAHCVNNLALVADALGRREEALELFRESLRIAREVGDRRSGANALHNLGVFMRRDADAASPAAFREAKALISEALEAYRAIGAQEQVALALYNLADAACALGQFEEAMERHREALRIAVRMEATPLVLGILAGVATLLSGNGERDFPLELLALVSRHPAADRGVRERAERSLEALRPTVAPERFTELCRRAEGRPVRELLPELLGAAA